MRAAGLVLVVGVLAVVASPGEGEFIDCNLCLIPLAHSRPTAANIKLTQLSPFSQSAGGPIDTM